MSRDRNSSSRDAKRARFSGEDRKKLGRPSPLVLIVGLAVVFALIGGTVFILRRPSGDKVRAQSPLDASSQAASPDLPVQAATQGHDPYPLVKAENGAVRLSLSTFDDNQAHFYTYMAQGRPVEFFVIKSKDGVVRVALNACDVCFPAKKGYHQEGDEMVCNNCGRRFPADQIGLIRGGCNPSPLKPTVQGDTVVIQESELATGLSMF